MKETTLCLNEKEVTYLKDILDAQLIRLSDLLSKTEPETLGSTLIETNIEQTMELLLRLTMIESEMEE